MGDHYRNRPSSIFCANCGQKHPSRGTGGKRWCPVCKDKQEFAYYIPTKEQIQAACEEFQKYWTPALREARCAYPTQEVDFRAYYGRQHS